MTAIVLGLESSCDETAAAIVRADRTVLARRVASQDDAHRPYGGVVPEIAARAHVELLTPMVEAVLADAGLALGQVDAVAATAGPGLIGGVMVGLVTAKALALAASRPLIAVNHLEGHALSPRLSDPGLAFPYLLLLASGGHCQLLAVEGVGRYRRLATTIDDAAGEAFDKVAKILGLGFPGGPAVERAAAAGDPARFPFPRPLIRSDEPHFSFAGLKTAVLRAAQASTPAGTPTQSRSSRAKSRDARPLRASLDAVYPERPPQADSRRARDERLTETTQTQSDLAASFQQAIVDCLVDRSARAMAAFPQANAFVVAGGVAANAVIRAALAGLADTHDLPFVAPPPWLCTDNAAMIAWAGAERLAQGLTDPLDAPARARWPLDPTAAPARGAGVKA